MFEAKFPNLFKSSRIDLDPLDTQKLLWYHNFEVCFLFLYIVIYYRRFTMAEIIKAYREPIPAMRFIGKRYSNYGHWGEFFANGWFDVIESAMGGTDSILQIWKNGGAYVGLERRKEGEPFAYYLGMFTPPGTEVPDGFDSIDFPAGSLATCWIYGTEKSVHGVKGKKAALAEAGIEISADAEGAIWSFENCLCPRYTTPDEKGNVILDYCYFAPEGEI